MPRYTIIDEDGKSQTWKFGCLFKDLDEPIIKNLVGRDRSGAIPKEPTTCAMARCLSRLPGVEVVHVHNRVVYLIQELPLNYKPGKRYDDQPRSYEPGYGLRGYLSTEDWDKKRSFDESNYGYFPLGDIRILPPPPSGRLGARRGTRSGSNKRTGRTINVFKAQPTRVYPSDAEL